MVIGLSTTLCSRHRGLLIASDRANKIGETTWQVEVRKRLRKTNKRKADLFGIAFG